MVLGRPGRPVVTPLGRFVSAAKAAAAHGLSSSHGHARAKRQIDGWHFEDERPRFRRKWAIAVATPDGDFTTVSAAAKHHGICCATVDARVRRGEPGWHYLDANRAEPRHGEAERSPTQPLECDRPPA